MSTSDGSQKFSLFFWLLRNHVKSMAYHVVGKKNRKKGKKGRKKGENEQNKIKSNIEAPPATMAKWH